jgi:hypothetical protein
LSDVKKVDRIVQLISLGGREINRPEQIQTLAEAMYRDPSIRAAYIKGLNMVALSHDKVGFFENGKLSVGLDASGAKSMLDILKAEETLQEMKKSGREKLSATKEKVTADPRLTERQREALLTKIEQSSQLLGNDEALRSFALDYSLALTNRRLGLGAAAGVDMNTLLADGVTLSAGIGKEFGGKLGGMLALVFVKEIYNSEKIDLGVHYGAGFGGELMLMGGLHGRYDDILASMTRTPLGNAFYLGLRVGKNRNEAEKIQTSLQAAQAEIRKLAEVTDITQINLSSLISNPALSRRMTEELRVLLGKNGFA